MNKSIFLTKGSLLGSFAKYAVAQSPYHRPDNLELVLDKLNEMVAPHFDKAPLGVAEFSDRLNLEGYLHRHLAQIPEYVDWNERKNGNDAPMKFTSRYDTDDNPDDDFIDLEALERNVAVEIERECHDRGHAIADTEQAKHQIYTDLLELADIPQPTYINDLSAPESWNAVKDKLRAAIREYCGVHDER